MGARRSARPMPPTTAGERMALTNRARPRRAARPRTRGPTVQTAQTGRATATIRVGLTTRVRRMGRMPRAVQVTPLVTHLLRAPPAVRGVAIQRALVISASLTTSAATAARHARIAPGPFHLSTARVGRARALQTMVRPAAARMSRRVRLDASPFGKTRAARPMGCVGARRPFRRFRAANEIVADVCGGRGDHSQISKRGVGESSPA
jgi:hypothetical protein